MASPTKIVFLLGLVAGFAFGSAAEVEVDRATGVYAVEDSSLGWKLSGRAEAPIQGYARVSRTDRNGRLTLYSFECRMSGIPVKCEIRCYKDRPAVFFRLRYLEKASKAIPFPSFTSIPAGLRGFSYRDSTFAPASFSLNQTGTPWLLFNDQAQAMIFSPASQFMIAKMVGDGKASMGASLNDRLVEVPKGLEQDSLLVISNGIQSAWDQWGEALRNLYSRKIPTPDQGPILKTFGYWTDNGADYYYNYDTDKGYAGTLRALVQRYREEGIPLGYLQLDSWWYQKSIDDPSGKPGGATKNSKLPAETWNRYGGTLVYRAHPSLFPNGLAAFQKEIGLPLVTHGRWIDRNSPDHKMYKFSGVGSIDPAWWNDTADYLSSSGVFCYEQDWLDRIYDNSPDMARVAGVADAFTDSMANACMRSKLWMQYCMPTPRFIMQGLKYANLSTIRVSDDRFDRGKWAPFLYCSQFADEIGARPWCDVFKSGETGNMILAVLSAGPVGTGDALGKENKENILKAVRADGVIVRPDRALRPCDQTYLDQNAPFLASTVTDQHGYKNHYLFAFSRTKGKDSVRVSPKDVGVDRPSYLFDLVTGIATPVEASRALDLHVDPDRYGYWMIAPVSQCGIVVLGDLDNFVPTGKQRIPWIIESKNMVRVEIDAAPGETHLTLQGISPSAPKVNGLVGEAHLTHFDESTHRFEVSVTPAGGKAVVILKP